MTESRPCGCSAPRPQPLRVSGGWVGTRRDTGSGKSHRGGAAQGRASPRRGQPRGRRRGARRPGRRARSCAARVRDADHGRDEGCGELRDVVDHDVRWPLLDDGEQVVRAWLQFDPDEELREDEAANVRRRKRGSKTPYPAGEQPGMSGASPTEVAVDALRFGGADDRLARCDPHVVSCFGEGACMAASRSVVTHQRSARIAGAHASHHARRDAVTTWRCLFGTQGQPSRFRLAGSGLGVNSFQCPSETVSDGAVGHLDGGLIVDRIRRIWGFRPPIAPRWPWCCPAGPRDPRAGRWRSRRCPARCRRPWAAPSRRSTPQYEG